MKRLGGAEQRLNAQWRVRQWRNGRLLAQWNSRQRPMKRGLELLVIAGLGRHCGSAPRKCPRGEPGGRCRAQIDGSAQQRGQLLSMNRETRQTLFHRLALLYGSEATGQYFHKRHEIYSSTK
jgi:hypothetical protein